jgi:hypothetical protein
VAETLTWKLCQFALGRPLTAADAGSVAEVHRRATAAGGSYRDCLKALIQSDLVLLGRTELLAASPARKATPP